MLARAGFEVDGLRWRHGHRPRRAQPPSLVRRRACVPGDDPRAHRGIRAGALGAQPARAHRQDVRVQERHQGGTAPVRRRDGGPLRPALRHRASPSRRARAPHDRAALRRGSSSGGSVARGERQTRIRRLGRPGPTSSRSPVPRLGEDRPVPGGGGAPGRGDREHGFPPGLPRAWTWARPRPRRPERARVPHHGLDLVDPDERYSAGRFARDARRWIAEIRGRGRIADRGGRHRVLPQGTPGAPVRGAGSGRGAPRSRCGASSPPQPPERLACWVRRLDPERAGLAVEGGRQRMSPHAGGRAPLGTGALGVASCRTRRKRGAWRRSWWSSRSPVTPSTAVSTRGRRT